MLSATGRKYLRGPRGTGFLFVRKSVISRLEPVLLDLHAADWVSRDEYVIRSDARRFENWEGNYAGKIGLGVAIDYVLGWGIESIWRRISDLASALRAGLRAIPGVTVRDQGAQQCGIVGFTADGKEPEEIQRELSAERINVWTSPLRFTRLEMSRRGLESVVRASVHYYNSEQEVDRFCEVLARMLK
jgi:cysteine desulfurase / selenocysteine lyase